MNGEYLKIETAKELQQLKEENKILKKNQNAFLKIIEEATKYIKSNSYSILVLRSHGQKSGIKSYFNKNADPDDLLFILKGEDKE